jgi:hypothetical protein
MDPSPRKIGILRYLAAGVFIVSLFTILGADIYALRFSKFIPSPRWAEISLWIGILVGIAGGMLAFVPHPVSNRTPFLLRSCWSRLVGYTVVLFLSGYYAFLSGIPAWYTSIAGSYADQIVTVKQWHVGTRRGHCAGPSIEEAPWLISVCMDYSLRTYVSPGTRLILRGKATALGMNVYFFDIQGRQILPVLPSP